MTKAYMDPYINIRGDAITKFLFPYRQMHPPRTFEVGAVSVPEGPELITSIPQYHVYVKDLNGNERNLNVPFGEINPLIKRIRDELDKMHHRTELGNHPNIYDVIETPDRT